jgi:hypothetical protein
MNTDNNEMIQKNEIQNVEIKNNIKNDPVILENGNQIVYSKKGLKYIYNPTTNKRYKAYEKKGKKQAKFNEEERQNRLYIAYIKNGITKCNTDMMTDDEKKELLLIMLNFEKNLIPPVEKKKKKKV